MGVLPPRSLGAARLRTAWVAAGVLGCLLPVSGVHAQTDTADAAPAGVQGRVVDAATGAPIAGAFVSLSDLDWGVLTDADGRFLLRVDPSPRYRVEVQNLGFQTLEREIERPGPDLTLEIEADPVQLEELRVMVDRFRFRRRAAAMSVTAFERDALLADASTDVMQFLQSRTGRPLRECPFRNAFASLCIRARGRWQPVRVYVDEMPVFGGLSELRTYKPQELYMIEVYNLGAHIRLYSTHYMDRLVRSGRRLTPIPIG